MRYLHTMVRVNNVEESMKFYCEGLGLKESHRHENEGGKYTLIFLEDPGGSDAKLELTYNWGDPEDFGDERNWGHLAYETDDIYALCSHLQGMGYTINRPPRDGHMAFVRSPDRISIELIQNNDKPLESAEPWASMENSGKW